MKSLDLYLKMFLVVVTTEVLLGAQDWIQKGTGLFLMLGWTPRLHETEETTGISQWKEKKREREEIL